MVNFLANLPNLFRERYLNKHESYLNALAGVIANMYLSWNLNSPNYGQLAAFFGNYDFPVKLNDDPDADQPQFRNLRNAWYHEVALRYPEDFETRVKFAGWKINEAYYCIFSSIASMVRCLRPEGGMSHDMTLNFYATNLVSSRKFSRSFLCPANTFLNQDGRPENVRLIELIDQDKRFFYPKIIECLQSARKGSSSRTTIAHYLKSLREWATYEDAYLLFRMYGETVKQNLDRALQILCSFYLAHTEVFLIRAFGHDAVRLQYNRFIQELGWNMKQTDPHLEARFAAYEQFLPK